MASCLHAADEQLRVANLATPDLEVAVALVRLARKRRSMSWRDPPPMSVAGRCVAERAECGIESLLAASVGFVVGFRGMVCG